MGARANGKAERCNGVETVRKILFKLIDLIKWGRKKGEDWYLGR
jgi:hypothetical protein